VRYSKQLKELVLTSGAYKEQRQLVKIIYKNDLLNDYYDIMQSFNQKHAADSWQCISALVEGRKKKTRRIKKRNEKMISKGDARFLTLTFTDEVLASTTEQTRRRYVARYLKEISFIYVANIDYGEDFGREHYHAVINIPETTRRKKWIYGYSKVKKIGFYETDNKRTSKYMTKLSHHALKESGQFKRLIYSRKVVQYNCFKVPSGD
jgi:hypothetical protein